MADTVFKDGCPRTNTMLQFEHTLEGGKKITLVPIEHAHNMELELHRLRSTQMSFRSAIAKIGALTKKVPSSKAKDDIQDVCQIVMDGTKLIMSDTEIRLGEALSWLNEHVVEVAPVGSVDVMSEEIISVLAEFQRRMEETNPTPKTK